MLVSLYITLSILSFIEPEYGGRILNCGLRAHWTVSLLSYHRFLFFLFLYTQVLICPVGEGGHDEPGELRWAQAAVKLTWRCRRMYRDNGVKEDKRGEDRIIGKNQRNIKEKI